MRGTVNITLIFSRHKEGGACTAKALLQIISYINPDVIFEELSEKLYEEAYAAKTLNNLESVAIREYLSKKSILNIPVDTFDRPKHYDLNQDTLNHKLSTAAGYESAQLRNFLDKVITVGNQYGFHYLNDAANDTNIEVLDDLKRKALKKLNDPKLDELYRIDQEVISKREDVMLDNVYRYASENAFSNGLMFIGSGHRASMLKKIEERMKTEDETINWLYYSDLRSVSN